LFSAEDLQRREQRALTALREFDKGHGSVDGTVSAVMDYHQFLVRGDGEDTTDQDRELAKTHARIERTLQDQPWKACDCAICRSAGVEVIIFRASNRNKRRGFHNLGVYHRHLHKTLEASA
jgi:hypothetical protein